MPFFLIWDVKGSCPGNTLTIILKPFYFFVKIVWTSVTKIQGSFSILTANLILGEILNLFSQFGRVLEPGGWLILSGILREQVKEVEERFTQYGFFEKERLYHQDWGCLIAKKMNSGAKN